jgi:membrane-associated phospholipid phosphatase
MKIDRCHRPAGFLLLLTLLAGPAASQGQELSAAGIIAAPDVDQAPTAESAGAPAAGNASFPHLVLTDLRDVLGAPIRWRGPEWGRFSLGVAGVGAAALLDRTVRDAARRDHSNVSDRIANVFEPLGSAGAFGVLGSFYVAGLVRGDSRARSVAEDGLIASVIAGGIVTPVLKFAVGRTRPRDTPKTFDFHPFSGASSFPSGHTTEAFAVASVIATHYDSGWVKGVSYGSAALVGFARIHHDAHFLSDVTAGALIGTAVGRSVVHHNQGERSRYTLAPIVGPKDQPGVAVAFSF